MKKGVIVGFGLLMGLFLTYTAKADTWTQKYLVDEATSKVDGAMDGVQDTYGNKWFTTASSTGDPNLTQKIYEYTVDGTWINDNDTVNNLITTEGKAKTLIYADKAGNVWLLGGGCLLVHNSSGWSRVSTTEISQQLFGISSDGYFFNFFGDDAGNLYAIVQFGDNKALAKRNSSGVWSKVFTEGPILESLASIGSLKGGYDETTGAMWFIPASSSPTELTGAYRYLNGQWTHYTTADGLASDYPYMMLMGSNGNVWIFFDNASTDNISKGVSRFDGSSWTTFTSSNSGLTSGVLKHMSEDNEGKIWFTTVGGDFDGSYVAVYTPATNAWMYYSSRNGLNDFNAIGKTFVLGDEFWAVSGNTQGFFLIQQNDLTATLYGQVGGTIVEEASFGMLKKKKSKAKKVTVYRHVQKKKKWKWKVTKRTKTSSGWYKALNLPVGTYKVKVQGKRTKVATITSGDPYRLNF